MPDEIPEIKFSEKKFNCIQYGFYGLIGIVVPLAIIGLLTGGIVQTLVCIAVIIFMLMFGMYGVSPLSRRIYILNEAAKNPTETFERVYAEKREKLFEFREGIGKFETARNNFKTKADAFLKDYPEESKIYDEQLRAYDAALEDRKSKFKNASDNLKELRKQIDKASAMYIMALEAQMVNALATDVNYSAEKNLRLIAALNSVMTNVNQSFAELNNSMLESGEKDKDITSGVDSIGLSTNVSGAAFQAPTPGTPLNHLEVLLWVKKHGSTKGLQLLCRTTNEWKPVDSTNICTNSNYRVAF